MDITIGSWAIPAAINAILIIWMFLAAMNNSGWFAGVFEIIFSIIGTLFIWLTYFAIMYFTLK